MRAATSFLDPARLAAALPLLERRLAGLGAQKASKPPAKASVAAVFRWREREQRTLQLLFVRRGINERDTWSGQVAFPGGKRQKVADGAWESPRETAQRETLEEIGLDLTTPHFRWIGDLPAIETHLRTVFVTTQVYLLETPAEELEPQFRLQETEISDAFWVDVQELFNPARYQPLHWPIEGMVRPLATRPWLKNAVHACFGDFVFASIYLPRPNVPAPDDDVSAPRHPFDFILWGLTLRMVSDLMRAAKCPMPAHDVMPHFERRIGDAALYVYRFPDRDEDDDTRSEEVEGARRFSRSAPPPPLLLRVLDAARAPLSADASPASSAAAFNAQRSAVVVPAADGSGVRLGLLTPAPLWATLRPREAAREKAHAWPLGWSPDGALLAVGEGASASVWLCTTRAWAAGDAAPSTAAPSQLLLLRAELRLWISAKELAGATRVVAAFFRTSSRLFAVLDNGLLVTLDVQAPKLALLALKPFTGADDAHAPVMWLSDSDVTPLVKGAVVKRLGEWHAGVEAAAVDAARGATLVVAGGLRGPSDSLVRARASSLSVWKVRPREPFCELLDYTTATTAPSDASGPLQTVTRVVRWPLAFLFGSVAGREPRVLRGSVRQLAVSPDGAYMALLDAGGRFSVRQIDTCSSVLSWQRVNDAASTAAAAATTRVQSVLWLSADVLGFVLESGRAVYGALTTCDSDDAAQPGTVAATHAVVMLATQAAAPSSASSVRVDAVAGVPVRGSSDTGSSAVGALAGVQVVADSEQFVVQRFEKTELRAFVELLTASQQFDRALEIVAAHGGDTADSELDAVHRQVWTQFCDRAAVGAEDALSLLATDAASGFPSALVHLSSVRDKRWVVAECRRVVASDSFADMRAILETGLLAASGIVAAPDNDNDVDNDADAVRQQFQQWRYRLDTLRLVLAEDVVDAQVADGDDPERVAEQCYDGAVFAHFRRAPVVELAQQLARDARVGALRVLFQRNGYALVPRRLEVLSQLPASVSPFAYSDLLPAVGPDATGDATSDATLPQFFTLPPQTTYHECDDPLNSSLGSVGLESRVVAVELSAESRRDDTEAAELALFDRAARASPREQRDAYAAWFRARVLELDARFGQLASAFQLSSLARECLRGNWPDSAAKSAFDSFQHDVERLYYCVYPLQLSACALLSLSEWAALSPHDQILRVIGDWASATDAVDRIQAVFVAHRRDARYTLDAAFAALCETLARARSLVALEVCAQLVHHSNPALPVVERWIQSDAQLLRTALGVVYATTARGYFPDAAERGRHHRAFVEQLWTIFQSLPVRKAEDPPELAQLQVEVDEMEDFLVAMDVLSKYNVHSSPSELRELVGASSRAADELLELMCAFALPGADPDSAATTTPTTPTTLTTTTTTTTDEEAEGHAWIAVWHDALKLKTHVFGERLSQEAILDAILQHLLRHDVYVAAAEQLATNWLGMNSDALPHVVAVLLHTVQAKVDTLRGNSVAPHEQQTHAAARTCVEIATRVLSRAPDDAAAPHAAGARQFRHELELVDACELLDLLTYGALKLSPAAVRPLRDPAARLALVLEVFASNPSNYQPSPKARAWFAARGLEHVLSPASPSAPLDAVLYVAALLGVDSQQHQIMMKGAYAALYCADYDVAHALTAAVVARLAPSDTVAVDDDAGDDDDSADDDDALQHLLSLVLDLVSAASFRSWTKKLSLCRAVLSAAHVSSARLFRHQLMSLILSRMERLEAVDALAAELGLSEAAVDERRCRDASSGATKAGVEQLLLSELEIVVELLQEEKNDRGFLLRLLQKGFQLVSAVLAQQTAEDASDSDAALSSCSDEVARAERIVQQMTRVCFAEAIATAAQANNEPDDWSATVAIGGSYLRLWSEFARDERDVEAFWERDVLPRLSDAFAASQSGAATQALDRLVLQLHHLLLLHVAATDQAIDSDEVSGSELVRQLHDSRSRFDELAGSYDDAKRFVASRSLEPEEPPESDDAWATSDDAVADADSDARKPTPSRVAAQRGVFARLATRCQDAMLSQQKTHELEAMSAFLNAELDLERFARDAAYRERTILTLATRKEHYAAATQFASKYGVDASRCLFAYIESALLAPPPTTAGAARSRHEQLERAFRSDGDDFLAQALQQPLAFGRLLLGDDSDGGGSESVYDALDGTDHVGLLLVLRMVLECSKRAATLASDSALFPLSKASADRVTLLFLCLKRLKELAPLRTRDGDADVVDFKVLCAAPTCAALLTPPPPTSARDSRRVAVAAVMPFLTAKSIKLLTKLLQKLHGVSTSAVVVVYLSAKLRALWAEQQRARHSASDAADLAAAAYDACAPFFSVLSNEHVLLVHCLVLGRRHRVALAIDTAEEFYRQPIDGLALYGRFFAPLKRLAIISDTLALFQTRYEAWQASSASSADADSVTVDAAKQNELRFLERELAQAAVWFVASEVTRHNALFAFGAASWQLWEQRMREWFASVETTAAEPTAAEPTESLSPDREELVEVLALLCQSVSSVDTASLMVKLVLRASQCADDDDNAATLQHVYARAFASVVMTQLDSDDATQTIVDEWTAGVPDGAHSVVSAQFSAVAGFLSALCSPSAPPARQLHAHVVSQLAHVSSSALKAVAVATSAGKSTGVAHAAVVAAWRRLSAQWDDEHQYAPSSVLARLVLDSDVVAGDSEREFFGLQTKAVVAHLSSTNSNAQAAHALSAVLSLPTTQVYERFDTVFASLIALVDSATSDATLSRRATRALANLLSFHARTAAALHDAPGPEPPHTWAEEQHVAVATRLRSQFGLGDDAALSRSGAVVANDNNDNDSEWWATLLLRGHWGDDAALLTWYRTTAFGRLRSPRALEAFATAHWGARRRVCVQLLLTAPFPELHAHHRERLLSFAAADIDSNATATTATTTTTTLELLLLRFDLRELLAAGLYPTLLPLFVADDSPTRRRPSLWTSSGEYAVCALVALGEVASAARLACALWRVHPLLWDFENARLTLANYLKALAAESGGGGDRALVTLRRAVCAQASTAFQRSVLL
ncbi:hypothetical protein PybrP1_003110 [[Pythium] brassicae (nom. inval.)]|nr:hypothetical protein PybrP1_003110 [[Pythium] brassicae (nom. inval.)]